MGITHEIAGKAENLTWKNITVIQYDRVIMEDPYSGIRAAIFLYAARGGIVRNIRFEDILIKSSRSKPLTINNEPSKKFGYAKISNLLFKNITADQIADPRISIVDGSGEGRIHNIQFDHVVLNGEGLSDADDRIFIRGAHSILTR